AGPPAQGLLQEDVRHRAGRPYDQGPGAGGRLLRQQPDQGQLRERGHAAPRREQGRPPEERAVAGLVVSEAALAWVEVRKAYASGSLALDGLSLSLQPGRVLVLLGTSGSGKTTALKTLNRLVTPDAGQVTVLGRDVAAWDAVELRRRIGYVIQEAGLLPHM